MKNNCSDLHMIKETDSFNRVMIYCEINFIMLELIQKLSDTYFDFLSDDYADI